MSWQDDPDVSTAAPWDSDPDVEPKAKPTGQRAMVLGGLQGFASRFGDELAGLRGKMALNNPVRLGKAFRSSPDDTPEIRALKESALAEQSAQPTNYQLTRDLAREEMAAAAKEHPGLYHGSELLGAVAQSFIPGAGLAKGATLAQSAGKMAALGSVAGLGDSDADVSQGDAQNIGRAALDTSLGAVAGGLGGAAGYGVEKGANALARLAARRSAAIRGGVAEAADVTAKQGTASARSAAGTSATAAYKNATNIDEAIKAGAMTISDLKPEQLTAYRGLIRERAQKAAEQLAADAARKTGKAAEYAEAMATETARARQIAEDKLGRGELKRQIKDRALRYGLPMVGTTALAATTGHDSPLELLGAAGVGGLAGQGMRPMMHSMLRLARQPVVKNGLWNLVEKSAKGTGATAAPRMMLGAGAPQTPIPRSAAAVFAELLGRQEEEDAYAGR